MVATATSNFMIGVTAAASAIVYYRRGDILVEVAAPLAVGVFVGSLLGARLAPRIHTKIVVYLLVGVMFYLAGHLAIHLWKVRYESTARARIRSRRGAGASYRSIWLLLHHAGWTDRRNIRYRAHPGQTSSASGVLLMLATPVVRVMVACYLVLSEKKTTSTDGSRWAC